MDRRLWQGAFILTLASLIIKFLSAVYRLPYQNLAGDLGLYVYQQVYPFYAFAVIMAGYGFPVVLSKRFAEYQDDISSRRVGSLFYTALFSIMFFSFIVYLFLFIGAPFIARFMGDVKLVGPLHIIAFAFLFVPLVATMRGLFQGAFYHMHPTALSQITEQTIRVTIIIGLSIYLFLIQASPYAFGKAAALGSTLAPVGSTIVLIAFLIKWHRRDKLALNYWVKPNLKLGLQIIYEGLAFSISSIALVCIQFIDVMTLVPLLHHFGAPLKTAKITKGIFDRSYPLVQMGITAAVALSMSVVPLLTKSLRIKSPQLKSQMAFALRVSIILGSAAALGLMLISRETDIMLFKNSYGVSVIRWMALSIFFMSIVMVSSTILQSMGYLWRPVGHVAIALVAKGLLNRLLIPDFHINGAAVASVVATAIIASLNIYKLVKQYKITIIPKSQIKKIFLSLFVMGVVVYITRVALQDAMTLTDIRERWESTIIALISVGVGAISFLLILFKVRLLSMQEIQQIPGGKKFFSLFAKHY